MPGGGLSLRQIAKVFLWQKTSALVAFLVIFVPVAFKTLTEPRFYTASTKLLYRGSNPNLSFGGGIVRLGPEEELNTEMELIRSRPVMEKVLTKLVAWKKAHPAVTGSSEEKLPEPGTPGWMKAVEELAKGIEVKRVGSSNLLEIRYTAQDPAEAAFVASVAADEYVRAHVQVQRSGQAEAFFAERIQDTRARLDSLEQTLLAVRRKHGVVSYAQQERLALDRLNSFVQRLDQLRAEIVRRELRLEQLRKAIRGEKLELPGWEIADHPLVLQLRQRLADLQFQKADLSQRFQPGYQGLARLDQQIQSVQQQLRRQLQELAEVEEASLASLRAEEKALESALRYLRREVESLPEKERAIAELQLAIEETRRIYSLLLQRYEEARITEASDPRVANVVVVDPARVPTEPSGPRRARNLVLGFLFGLVGAVAIALLSHRLDPTIKGPEDLSGVRAGTVISVAAARTTERTKPGTARAATGKGKG